MKKAKWLQRKVKQMNMYKVLMKPKREENETEFHSVTTQMILECFKEMF